MRRVTVSNCGAPGARDRGDLLRRAGAGARRRRSRPTRPSPSCSSRPSTCRGSAPCRRTAGDARRTSPRSGRRTWPWSTATASGPARIRDRPRPLHRPRRRRAARATAIVDGRPLSGTDRRGARPDLRARRRVRLEPGADGADRLLDHGGSARARGPRPDRQAPRRRRLRTRRRRWPGPRCRSQLHHLGINRGQAGQFQRLAGHLVFAAPTLQAGLGDHPGRPRPASRFSGASASPATFRSCWCASPTLHEIDLVREALLAVEYWRMRRLAVDLVILNERAASYVQDLQLALETLVRANQSQAPDRRGARSRPRLPAARRPDPGGRARHAARSVARVVLVGERGRLETSWRTRPTAGPPRPPPRRSAVRCRSCRSRAPRPISSTSTGSAASPTPAASTSTIIGPGQSTPAPWINVIANPDFGFQVSADGGGYAWSVNSRERQLTPWSNDPVTDQPSQVIYVRDEETGELWTPTAAPIRDEAATYVARHGFGYSRFQHPSRGLALDLLEYVAPDDPVRISRLACATPPALAGGSPSPPTWSGRLGASRQVSAPFVTTTRDEATGAIWPRQRLESGLRRPLRLPGPGRSPDRLDRRPARVPRPQRLAGRAAGAWSSARRSPDALGGRPRSLRGAADDARAGAGRERREFRSSWVTPTNEAAGARLVARLSRSADLDAVLAEVRAALG